MDFYIETKNLEFSHSTPLPKVKHKFAVGELVFIKLKDELCLIFIHYLSQKLVFCTCSGNDNKVKPIGLSSSATEAIFHDYRSHQLYCQMGNDSQINHNNVHAYYIPMYFISFPGYRKKCSRFFRFWIKESDIIPYHVVRNKLPDKPIYKLDDISLALKASFEDPLLKSVDNIDDYVYNIKHRTIDISKHLAVENDSTPSFPWDIPRWLQEFMNNESERINSLDWEMDISANFTWKTQEMNRSERIIKQFQLLKQYSPAPFYRKFNARSLANEFKFYILLIGKILLKTNRKNVKLWNKEVKVNYQTFLSFYVNQLYWIDILIEWFDINFINTCCYCKEERLFLTALLNSYHRIQKETSGAVNGNKCSKNGYIDYIPYMETYVDSNFEDWKMKPSELLGASHLARALCYPVFYNNYLSKLFVNDVSIESTAFPIYQLFIYFITYNLKDYTSSQEYILD